MVPVNTLGKGSLEASGLAKGEATAAAQPLPFFLGEGNAGHVQGGLGVGHERAGGMIGNYPVVEDASAVGSGCGHADGFAAKGARRAIMRFAFVVFAWDEEVGEGDGVDVRKP